MTKDEAVNVFDVAIRGNTLPTNIEELVPLSFIGQTAVNYYREKIALMNKIGVAEGQKKATLQDGRDAAEMLYNIESRIGELLPTPEEAYLSSRPTSKEGRPARSNKILPDGVTSKKAHTARTLASPEGKAAWEEVKKEAEENEDIPTKTAVLNKVRAKKAEEMVARAKERAEEKRAQETDKEVEENKRFVAEYLNTIRVFTKQLEIAIIGAEKGKFDYAGKNFITEKHNKVRDLMRTLEGMV